MRGMRLDDIDLSGADLTDADLTGVTMTGGSLRGATITGGKWNHAAILGTDGAGDPALAGALELAAAAIAGRDSVDVIINAPYAQANCVGFSADGSLLAFGSGHEVKIADTSTGRVLRVLPGHQDPDHQGIVTAVAFSPRRRHARHRVHRRLSACLGCRHWGLPDGAGPGLRARCGRGHRTRGSREHRRVLA